MTDPVDVMALFAQAFAGGALVGLFVIVVSVMR